jgi:chitinase
MNTKICALVAAGAAGLLLSLAAYGGAPLYTITVSVVGGGEVTLDPEKAGYQKNNIVTLTAVPATGWSFVGWSGDLSGTQNPITLRVSGNHAVTASFAEGGTGGGGGGGGGAEPPAVPPPTGLLPDRGMVVGYFAQWTIYRRGYLPKHVFTSGSLGRLDVINYAFAAPDANGRCASLDTFADWGRRYDASESVDGVADAVSQPLKGNFNQLIKLKAKNPALRVLISLGGWTESYRFSAIAADEQKRKDFVASCVDMFIRGHFADGIVQTGIFDGIDLDWEYPGSCGATCDFSPADRQNFVALLKEFRAQLEAQEAIDRRDYLLTIAAPAGKAHYDPIDLAGIEPYVDWINVMAYDFHGGWESAGPTNHIAALFPSACESSDGDWADKAIRAYLGSGITAGKLVLGMPFYGRGWRAAAVGDGLCVPASGVPRGTYEKVRPGFGDAATGTHWDFDGSQFWSYDNPESAGWKADYANCRGLRGVMFWELSGDDPSATLLDSLHGKLETASPICDAWPSLLP